MIGVGAVETGLIVLCATLGCIFAATHRVVVRRLPHLHGTPRLLAWSAIATALVLAAHIVPGALAILSRWTVVLTAATLAAGTWLLTRTPQPARRAEVELLPRERVASRFTSLSWLPALLATGLILGYSVKYLRGTFGTVPLGLDALTFHLPDVATWIRSGSLWPVSQFVPGLANGNYPNNGDVLFLATILPFKSVFLVRAAMVLPLVLLGVGMYVIGRELLAPPTSAVLFSAAACSVPAVLRPALFDTQTDTLMLFGFATGIAFLLRYGRTRLRSDLLLAGVGLGISFGTKWYAVPCVLFVLLTWACTSRVVQGRGSGVTARGLWLLSAVFVVGGFWLLRNLVQAGNPFFPLKVAPFGLTIFDAPADYVRQQGGFTVADYLGSPSVLTNYILPALRQTVSWIGLLFVGGSLVGAGLGVWEVRRTGVRSRGGLLLLMSLGALALAAIYSVTPDTALGPRGMPTQAASNTRYLMPAIVVAAPLLAVLCGRVGGLKMVIEIVAVILIVEALSRVYNLRSLMALAIALAVVVGGMLWQAGLHNGARAAFHLALRPAILAPVGALVLVGTAFWGRSHLDYGAYANGDATLSWLLTHAPSGHRVGVAGLWSNDGLSPVLPAFGPRLGNEVRYVGPSVIHMLGQYRTRTAFAKALRERAYDLLLVGLGFPTPKPTVSYEGWARAAGYSEVARSRRLVLFVLPVAHS